jgi:hypothetical protein
MNIRKPRFSDVVVIVLFASALPIARNYYFIGRRA